MTKSVTTGLAVAAVVITFGGAAFAQGLSTNSRARGSGGLTVAPGGADGSLSGSGRTGAQVDAPGAGVGIGSRTTGQGAVGVGRNGIGGNVGGGGDARGGVRVGR